MPTFVEYVGKRPTYTDNLYGTGDWRQGEVKPVHDLTARKMLRHADQYGEPKTQTDAATTEPTTDDVVGEPKTQTDADKVEEDLQNARDAIQNMDKATLIDYAKTHFRQTLDGRASVDKTRAEVIRLIDQYGLS